MEDVVVMTNVSVGTISLNFEISGADKVVWVAVERERALQGLVRQLLKLSTQRHQVFQLPLFIITKVSESD